MNRRDFIKNSLLCIGCVSCAMAGKSFYNYNKEMNLGNGIFLTKDDLKFKYLTKDELPKNVKIEACSLCQLNCVKCYMREYPQKAKNGCGYGYLKFSDFKKFVDDNKFNSIELSKNGEIFLNPELLDIIKYAYKKNITLTAYTGVNLNYLTEEMAEALVKYKFSRMTVSIDGASPETYSIYRRGGDFNTVINNIKKINYYKQKYNSKFPELVYKFILFGHNEHEIDKAKILAKKLNMYIAFVLNYDPSYSPVKNIAMVKEKTGCDCSIEPKVSMVEAFQKNHNNILFCKELWTAPQINWDGRIFGCCVNYEQDFGGNAFKEGLLSALNDSKILYAKKMLTKISEPIASIPCSSCNTYKIMHSINFALKPKDKEGSEWL